MAPEKEKDIYSERLEKRKAEREEAERNELLQKQEAEIREINSKFEFITNGVNYVLKVNQKPLDMKFKNFEALKNAANAINSALIAYGEGFWSKSKKPKFYEKGWEIFVNNWIIDDTKYMSSTLTSLFLKRSSTLSPEWRAEIQRLADFLNEVVWVKN